MLVEVEEEEGQVEMGGREVLGVDFGYTLALADSTQYTAR
jgi:hypothetical protein